MPTWVCATCGPVPAGTIRHLDHDSPHGHETHECGSSAGLDWTKKEHDMNKIPTLFLRTPDRRFVTTEVNPDCQWVLDGEGTATRKYDGTCISYFGNRWWARREVKPGKKAPEGFIEISFDLVTEKTMGWEPIEGSGFLKYLIEAHANYPDRDYAIGTYELCGPKVNGNPEGFDRHILIRHDDAEKFVAPRDYVELAEWMAATQYEGIVWHHPDGRMAKLKRRDFAHN